MGGFKPESIDINYADGVSTGTKIIDKVSGYDDFSTVNSTASKILREEAYLNWKVSSIDYNSFSGVKTYAPTLLPKVCTGVVAGKAPYAKASSNWRVPKELVIYTIWDEPIKPWSTADTLLAADNPLGTGDLDDNPHQPWQKAMDFSMAPVFANSNDKSDTEFLKSLTTYLHGGHGLVYDTINGDTQYINFVHNETVIQLDNYIEKSLGNTNCFTQAAAIQSFSYLNGLDVEFHYLKPFGYINETLLVGRRNRTNNPFYNNPKYSGSELVGKDEVEPVRSFFGSHGVNGYNALIYDACAGPVLGRNNLDDYCRDVIDSSTSDERKLSIFGSSAPIKLKVPLRDIK